MQKQTLRRVAVAFALLMPPNAQASVCSSHSSLAVQIVHVRVPPRRPDGQQWDCEEGGRSRSVVMDAIKTAKSILMPKQCLPDLYVELKDSSGRSAQTSIKRNQLLASWPKPILFPGFTTGGMITLSLFDKNPLSTTKIASFQLAPKKGMNVATTTLTGPSGETVTVKYRWIRDFTRIRQGRYALKILAKLPSRKKTGKRWDVPYSPKGSAPDAFITLQIGGRALRGSVVKNSYTPSWQFSRLKIGKQKINIKLFDKDLLRHDLISQCTFSIRGACYDAGTGRLARVIKCGRTDILLFLKKK